jgi:hypothetical protein
VWARWVERRDAAAIERLGERIAGHGRDAPPSEAHEAASQRAYPPFAKKKSDK